MAAMIGAGGIGRKPGSPAGFARVADVAAAGLLLAAGLAWCGARALSRGADLAAAPPPPDPAGVLHRVDLATAGAAELRLLPGVGPRVADRIMEERAARGPFADLEDVDRRVPGVGPARVRWWRGRVSLPREGGPTGAPGGSR
jgi:competence protein ComEA